MSETTQLAIVGVLVVAAALYVLRATWKTWFGKSEKSCGTGCGKCATSHEPEQKGRYPLPQA